MGRFIEGADRTQMTLLPEAIDDYVGEKNPVRVVDAFVDALDLVALGFDGVVPEETGRPSYHPATMLLMVTICAIWGFQQVAVKPTSSDMAPTLQLTLRFGLTVPLVLGVAAFRGEATAILGAVWKPGLLVGFLFGLE